MGESKRNRVIALVLFASWFSISTANAASPVFVSSEQATIYKNASFSSQAIVKLGKNDLVDVVSEKGVWLKVKYAQYSGWISRYTVSNSKPPDEKISILGRLKRLLGDNDKRDRLILISTAGGIRGLTEEESDAVGRTDFKALSAIESISVSRDEIQQFLDSDSI